MPAIDRRFVSSESPTAPRQAPGGRPCQGVYHAPKTGRPRTALIATHYNIDFSEHYLGDYLAERGYGFLGWNTRFRGAEAYFLLEHALVDIGVGVRWLREQAGVERVVILGNSGGASLMGAYQSQAVEPTLEALPGMTLPEAVRSLPPADAFVALNAHRGRPEVLTTWLDPALPDESDPAAVDAALDMYNPDHGPPYPAAFVARYREAQVARNRRITAWAREELRRLAALGHGDRVFDLHRTWADLRFLDGALDPSDREVGVCYAGDPKRANYGPVGLGRSTTCRTWLSMWSLEDSACRADLHLPRVQVPALVIQSLGDTGVFPSDARALHEALGAKDKGLEWIAGEHFLRTPETARAEVADRIAGWLAERHFQP